MRALRYPFALGSGALITSAIFYCLWRMISGPVEVLSHKPIPFPHFAPVRADSTKAPTPLPAQREVRPRLPRAGGIALGTDRDVVPLVRIRPAYPPAAAARDLEGWVKVEFSITPTGAVTDIRVIDSAPKGVFDEAAVQALRRWRYGPKVVNGRAVERVGVQTIITYRLDEK